VGGNPLESAVFAKGGVVIHGDLRFGEERGVGKRRFDKKAKKGQVDSWERVTTTWARNAKWGTLLIRHCEGGREAIKKKNGENYREAVFGRFWEGRGG